MANSTDVFKEVFKEMKRRLPPPDYSEVIDFNNLSGTFEGVKFAAPACDDNNDLCPKCDILGLKAHYIWSVYHLDKVPGLFFILNPFTATGQRLWIKRCVQKYPLYPNVTNFGVNSEKNDLWQNYVGNPHIGYNKLKKLRWTTLGYHHNWNTKRYSKDNISPFPNCLSDLTHHAAGVLGFNVLPEAAIINYYHLDSTLAGHTDQSEPDHTAPLLSFSFGRKAIFMIGGKDKSVRPISMFVKSGDIILMSGESRLSYHAVPKIFPQIEQEENSWTDENVWEEDWDLFENYLEETRINMNVRHVGEMCS